MKNLNFISIRVFLALSLALTGCSGSFSAKNLKRIPKLSPQGQNEEGETTYGLHPINSHIWNDPDVQAQEDAIAEERRRRVEERLAHIKDERIEFRNPVLILKDNGQKEISIDVLYKGQTHPTRFLSPEGHGEHFMFQKTSGFSQRRITLQGMCLGREHFCSKLAIEAAFYFENLKVTSQFELNLPEESADLSEEAESPEVLTEAPKITAPTQEDDLDLEIREDRPPHRADAPQPPSAPKAEEPVQVDTFSVSPQQPKTPSPTPNPHPPVVERRDQAPTEIQIEAPAAPSAPVTAEATPQVTTSGDTRPDRRGTPQQPALPSEEDAPQAQEEPPSPQAPVRSLRPRKRPDHLVEAQTTSPQQPDAPTPHRPLGKPGEIEDSNIAGRTPPTRPAEPSHDLTPSLDVATEAPTPNPHPPVVERRDQAPTGIQTEAPAAPSAPATAEATPQVTTSGDTRPDRRGTPQQPDLPSEEGAPQAQEEPPSPQAPVRSLRPRKRPDGLGEDTQVDVFEVEEADPVLVTGAGRIVFPNLETDPDVTEGFNVDSAEDFRIGTPVEDSQDHLLNEMRTTTYNQSKLFYAGDGHIRNASQLNTDLDGAVANPGRRHHQYGSGLSVDFLNYVSKKFSETYSDSPICINDLSRRNGGPIGGHSSHRNGLDMDISYPSSSNSCRSSFFNRWNSLDDNDSNFYKKNWDFINLMLSTERVHVIFTDTAFINRLCSYVKENTSLSRSARNRVFKKLHHIDGHANHYHVRLTCNEQNPGCTAQGQLRGSSCN